MFSKNTLKLKGKNTIDFIFIHGLTGSPGEFLSYIPLFKKKGNIHLISLPGHGQWKNELKPELTYKEIMDSFHEYIKKLNISRKIFIAHSISPSSTKHFNLPMKPLPIDIPIINDESLSSSQETMIYKCMFMNIYVKNIHIYQWII